MDIKLCGSDAVANSGTGGGGVAVVPSRVDRFQQVILEQRQIGNGGGAGTSRPQQTTFSNCQRVGRKNAEKSQLTGYINFILQRIWLGVQRLATKVQCYVGEVVQLPIRHFFPK